MIIQPYKMCIRDSTMLEAAAQTTEEVPLVISKTMVTMTCNNFNAVEDFEIPADAAAAV